MIEITAEPLSQDRCIASVAGPTNGAIATFLGVTRNHSGDVSTNYLEYEAYDEMACDVIEAIAREACSLWDVGRIAVQHRTGRVEIGDASVVIAVSAPHRGTAFEACRYVIDQLKTRAPIWKKEFGPDGESWVEGPMLTTSQTPVSRAE